MITYLLPADIDKIHSVVLRRLIEEVAEEKGIIRSYNRTHNRHNRSIGYNRTHNRHNRGR